MGCDHLNPAKASPFGCLPPAFLEMAFDEKMLTVLQKAGLRFGQSPDRHDVDSALSFLLRSVLRVV